MAGQSTEIRRLADDSIRRIVAEQAITDLASVVKELVDNALDAESNTIKVRLFGQGLEIIEVSDDGCGVPPASRPQLATRYATSKISSFEDIYAGTGLTMGFRGEALFSLACLSQKLVVATRTEEEELAQKLEFLRDGSLDINAVESFPRKVGTTVAAVQPFAALPARRADLMRRIRAERAKLFRLMEAYAIFNVGVQINLIEMTPPHNNENLLLATSPNSTKLEETVSSVMGHQFLVSLTSISIDLEEALGREKQDICKWEIKGLVSENPQTQQAKGRVVNYYCINGRVVELPNVTKLLRKVWNGFAGKKKPSCILCLTLPNDAFDINLSPDKQQVLLTKEQEICQLIENHVITLWSSKVNGVFQVQQALSQQPLPNNSFQNEALPTQDDDFADEGGDEGDRQMHKRRFAFVHDLGNAKLQHHLQSRQKCAGNEEKKQSEDEQTNESPGSQDAPETSTNDADENNSEPLTKKAKLDLIQQNLPPEEEETEEATNDTTSPSTRNECNPEPPVQESPKTDESPAAVGGSSEHQSTVTKSKIQPALSDQDRLGWNAIQSKFVSDDGEDDVQTQLREEDPVVIVESAQPDLQSQKSKKTNPQTAAKRSTRKKTRLTQGMTRSEVKSSLAQFAFQPRPDSRSEVPAKASHDGEEEEEEDDTSEGEESAGSENESKPEVSNESQKRPKRQARSQADSAPMPEEEIPDSPNTESSYSATAEKVVWESFRGTQATCESNRKERMNMLKRRSVCMDAAIKEGTYTMEEEECEEASATRLPPLSSDGSFITLSKSDFRGGMQIIGQFNLGFILARCSNNHLWILDQHACDEKHRFEKLCRETKIHEQKLLKPMPLDLDPSEEACVLDHMDIFEANGFRFDFNPNAPIRSRLSLTALPHSGAQDGRKAVQFGKDDVSALCAILADGSGYDTGSGGTGVDGTGKYGNNAVRRYASTGGTQKDSSDRIIARLPKAIAMFASRACRSSIMIGTALSQSEMEKVVHKLADVDHPWNCPHGRPTMRHVGKLLPAFLSDERKAAELIAGPTASIVPMTQEITTDD